MDKDLLRLKTELTGALAGLDSSQTQAAPPAHPEKWSIQQIVEHLILTWTASFPGIEERIVKRRPTRTKPTAWQRVGQVVLLRLGFFPTGRESPAVVSPSLPATLRSGEELTQRIDAVLSRLDDVVARAESLFGFRRSVNHAILGPLSMRQWRRFHLIHGLHHVKQIKAIRRDNRL